MKVENPAILIVEDDPNDQFLIQNAFKSIGIETAIRIVENGQEAIDYLNGKGIYSDRDKFPFPTTIITDLKMPILDGLGVLEHRRDNPHWAIIPTVVLSASEDLDDIKKAYMLGAAAYHVKPSDPIDLRRLLKQFLDYWRSVEIPQSDDRGQMLPTDSEGKLGERFSKGAEIESGRVM
jgi:CheY-like chemotaxis protein